MAKYDVFISYSRKDSEIANKICSALEKEGITYFIDRKGIGGGFEFPEVLANAICDSSLFLFLASENSYGSKFTINEVTFAFNKKSKQSILPYIIDKSQLPISLEFIFAGINWRTIKDHPVVPTLMNDLKNMLGRDIKESEEESKGISEVINKIKGKVEKGSKIIEPILENTYKYATNPLLNPLLKIPSLTKLLQNNSVVFPDQLSNNGEFQDIACETNEKDILFIYLDWKPKVKGEAKISLIYKDKKIAVHKQDIIKSKTNHTIFKVPAFKLDLVTGEYNEVKIGIEIVSLDKNDKESLVAYTEIHITLFYLSRGYGANPTELRIVD